MHFLPDVYVPCEVCGGHRYNRETLQVTYQRQEHRRGAGHDGGARRWRFFEQHTRHQAQAADAARRGPGLHPPGPARHHAFRRRGAARQAGRASCSSRQTGKTFYILDEPTTGLHFEDVRQLLERAPAPGGRREHGAGHRAQPGRRQVRGPYRGSGPRRRRRGAAPSSPRGRPKRSRRSPTATRGPSSSGCSRNPGHSSAQRLYRRVRTCDNALRHFFTGIRRLQERGRKAWQKRWRRRLGDIWRVAWPARLQGACAGAFPAHVPSCSWTATACPRCGSRARAWSSRRRASCS